VPDGVVDEVAEGLLHPARIGDDTQLPGGLN
jgi:hypothetical protein